MDKLPSNSQRNFCDWGLPKQLTNKLIKNLLSEMKIFYDNYKEYYVKMCSPKNNLKNCPQQRNYFLQSQNI